MKLLSGYVLNLDRRGAIVDALTEQRPAPEAMETKRAALHSEIRTLEDEQPGSLLRLRSRATSRRWRERAGSRASAHAPLAELAALDRAEQLSTFDVKRIERELRQRLADWRDDGHVSACIAGPCQPGARVTSDRCRVEISQACD
jgi:hypothetical protein